MTTTRIPLEFKDGELVAPCGCRVHVFDGKPDVVPMNAGDGRYTALVGILDPHWHHCPAHGPRPVA